MRVSSRLWLWRIPVLLGCVSAILFSAGFWLALRGESGEPIGSPPPAPRDPKPIPKPAGRRLLLVIGDSLARGTGDETGRGFAGALAEALRRRAAVELVNLGVNGAESEDVRASVESPNVRSLAASADWIVLAVGSNDLSHAGPRASGSPAQALEEVTRARRRYLDNLRAILAALRQSNSSAPILVLGLYSPFSEEGSATRLGASVILSWNTAAAETALSVAEVSLVPTFDLFFSRPERLAVDKFHPNRRGYEAIAQRILQDLPEELPVGRSSSVD